MAPGEAIPSEIELARRFGVSQGTVRKAIDALAADNLVVRRQGKGTFVATHTEENDVDVPVPAHPAQRRQGRVPGEPAARRPARQGERRDGPPSQPQPPATPCSCFAACSNMRDSPWFWTRSHYPAELFKGLTRARVESYRGSMYSFFETQFGVRMLKAQEKVKAIAADAASARVLNVEPGQPLLAVDRVTLTYGERPVEWRRGLCATKRHHYLNLLG